MTKEELKQEAEEWSFRKKYAYGYSYTFRQVLDAYIDSAEPREKRIEELEKDKQYFSDSLDKQIEATLKLDKENAELSEKLNRHKHDCPNCSAFGKHCPHKVNGDPYTYNCYLTVAELEKENAELDCQKNRNKFCYSCVNATEKCFKNEIGCPCDKYKSYKEELKKWKAEWQGQVQKATDEGYARTLQTIQLTKAKELLKESMNYLDTYHNAVKVYNFIAETEQFISEVEK